MMKPKLFYILLIGLALVSCHKVKPQAPANQPQEDSLDMAASMVNFRLAEEANKQCTRFVQEADTAYVLSDFGYWYSFKHRGTGAEIKEGDKVELFFATTTFDGALIEDSQVQLTVGRRESFFCFDDMLSAAHEGDQLRLIAPYYVAYGRDGNELVPPLTNVLIEIKEIRILQK